MSVPVSDMIFPGIIILISIFNVYLGIDTIRTDWDGLTAYDKHRIYTKAFLKTQYSAQFEDRQTYARNAIKKKRILLRNATSISLFISAGMLILFLFSAVWDNTSLLPVSVTGLFLSVPIGWCLAFLWHLVQGLHKEDQSV